MKIILENCKRAFLLFLKYAENTFRHGIFEKLFRRRTRRPQANAILVAQQPNIPTAETLQKQLEVLQAENDDLKNQHKLLDQLQKRLEVLEAKNHELKNQNNKLQESNILHENLLEAKKREQNVAPTAKPSSSPAITSTAPISAELGTPEINEAQKTLKDIMQLLEKLPATSRQTQSKNDSQLLTMVVTHAYILIKHLEREEQSLLKTKLLEKKLTKWINASKPIMVELVKHKLNLYNDVTISEKLSGVQTGFILCVQEEPTWYVKTHSQGSQKDKPSIREVDHKNY
jgi:hypothetical protein